MAISVRALPLNALRSFDAAARHLSFAAAADELMVTPAAVGTQVRRLEEWVGTPLFLRRHRTVSLTAAGQRLAPKLTAVFVDLERLLTEVTEIDADSLQVNTMQSFAVKWLAPRTASFNKHNPGLQLRITAEDRRVDFGRDDVDVAIRYGDGDYGELHSELIAQSVASPVCSPQLGADFPDLSSIPGGMLLQDESALVVPGLPTWESWFKTAGVVPLADAGGPLFRNAHVALAAAIASQGFALGLTPLIDLDIENGRLIRPFAHEQKSPFGFWFVTRKERLAERKISAFRDWVFSEAAVTHRP